MKEDKLILGGHEFTSRFILGSGKVSLELVQACIDKIPSLYKKIETIKIASIISNQL